MDKVIADLFVDEEFAVYEYSPTFGPHLLSGSNKIGALFINAQASGIAVSLKLVISTKNIYAYYSTRALEKLITISLSDLRSIEVSRSLPSSLVSLWCDDGLRVCFNCTRPHLVALDIWNGYCQGLVVLHGSKGNIDIAIREIRRCKVPTLKVPDDFLELRSDEAKIYIDNGFVFPINSPPYLNAEVLINNANTWYQKNNPNFTPAINSPCINANERNDLGSTNDLSIQGQEHNGYLAVDIYVPDFLIYRLPIFFIEWCVGIETNSYIDKNTLLGIVWDLDRNSSVSIYSTLAGNIQLKKKNRDSVLLGEVIATITSRETCLSSQASNSDLAPVNADKSRSTIIDVKNSLVPVISGSIPLFQPSIASVPIGFPSKGTAFEDLRFAFRYPDIAFQSFFSDTNILSIDGINDDIIGLPCFDEGMYCALVKEMHKYSLAEIADKKEELAKEKAGLGAMVGGLLGVFTMNPFAPFLGHSYGKSIADRGKRVEEFLPDPNLLFYEDPNSFLSWSRGQVGVVKLRRLMFVRCQSPGGSVYFRVLPAIVTADSVFPVQLFKLSDSSYFYRPISAGIERDQPNYDPIKIQKRYYHFRSEGQSSRTDLLLNVYGRDVEIDQSECVYKFSNGSFEYFYVDFKIQPGSLF